MPSKADLRIEDLRKKVTPLFNTYGPLCDSEGFYNHFGECWIDVIQMMFLFSDSIKRNIQTELLKADFDIETVDTKLRDNLQYERIFGTNDPQEEDIQLYFSYLVEFLKAFQLRFFRHYYTEYTRLTEIKGESRCTFEDLQGKMALQKIAETSFLARGKGQQGFRSALFAQKYTTYKNRNRFKITEKKGYQPGGTNEIPQISKLLIDYFLPRRGIKINDYPESYYNYYFNLYFLDNLEDKIFGYYIVWEDHLTCFYTCGGHSYYFDDVQGNLPFAWKEFMTFFKQTYVTAYKEKKALPVFYRGGSIHMYDTETDIDFFKFIDFPFLEYEAEDGTKHLYTKIFLGKDEYHTLDFLVQPRGEETKKYTWKKTIGKNTLEVILSYNYYEDKTSILEGIYEFVDTLNLAKRKKLISTSPYNIQTGQFIGARLNQAIPSNLLYRAELNTFLKTLGQGGEKHIDEQMGNEMTPLQTALFLRDIDSLNTLLQYGANPSLYNKVRTPLQDAIVYEDADEESDIEKRKETTFKLAKQLVEAGADINKENGRKRTALWYAIDSDNLTLTTYLLEKGAIVQGKNIEKVTPMNLVKQKLQTVKGNVTKQASLSRLLKTLKKKRESQESFRRYIQQLTQTRRR